MPPPKALRTTDRVATAAAQRQEVERIDRLAVGTHKLTSKRWASLLLIASEGSGHAKLQRDRETVLRRARSLAKQIERGLRENHTKLHELYEMWGEAKPCDPVNECIGTSPHMYDPELLPAHADVYQRVVEVSNFLLELLEQSPVEMPAMLPGIPQMRAGDEYGATLHRIRHELGIEPRSIALRVLVFLGDELPVKESRISSYATRIRTAISAHQRATKRARGSLARR